MLWCSPPKSQLHIAQCVWRCASFICWLVDECARSETRLTVKFTRVGEAQKKTLKKTKTKLVAAVDIIFNAQLFSSLNVRASLSPWLANTTGTHWLYHTLALPTGTPHFPRLLVAKPVHLTQTKLKHKKSVKECFSLMKSEWKLELRIKLRK